MLMPWIQHKFRFIWLQRYKFLRLFLQKLCQTYFSFQSESDTANQRPTGAIEVQGERRAELVRAMLSRSLQSLKSKSIKRGRAFALTARPTYAFDLPPRRCLGLVAAALSGRFWSTAISFPKFLIFHFSFLIFNLAKRCLGLVAAAPLGRLGQLQYYCKNRD